MRELKQSGDVRGIGEAAYAIGRELATLASVRLRDPAILATHFEPNPELLHGLNVNARLIDHFLESALLRERLGASTRHASTTSHGATTTLSAMSQSFTSRTATSIRRTSSCDNAPDVGPSRRSSTGSSRLKAPSPTTSATFCDTSERRTRALSRRSRAAWLTAESPCRMIGARLATRGSERVL